MGLLVLSLAIQLGFVTWHTETSVRISGYGLQLIGMLLAIRGLLAIREHFKQTPLRTLVIEWFKRFPLRMRVVTIGGSANLGSVTSTGYAEGYFADKPEDNIEDRLAVIIKNIDLLRSGLRQNTQGLDQLKRDYEQYKEEAEAKTKGLESRIKADRETFHTNDIITSLAGLVLLTIGITFSTLAPELHYLFN